MSKPEKQAKNRLTPKMIASQWKPGQSGNPAGRRPLACSLAEVVRDVGGELDKKTGRTLLELVVRKLYQDALSGRVQAAELVLSRGWGKPSSETDLPGRNLESELEVVRNLTDEELQKVSRFVEVLARGKRSHVEALLAGLDGRGEATPGLGA